MIKHISVRRIFTDDKLKREIWVLIITLFVVCLPLFCNQLPYGHDYSYHLLRIEGIKEGLLSGKFPVRVSPVFFNNYGYSTSLSYPDLFLYIPALFRIIGFGIEVSYKLFIVLISITTFISTYYCGREISKSNYAGLIIAIVFNLSQYHLQDIYTRFALGEVQAFMFLPLIVYGLYNLFFEDFNKNWLLIVGFSGLLYCHVITALTTLIITAILSLFFLNRIIRDKKKIIKLFFSGFLTLTITCAFWIPFIEQYIQINTSSFVAYTSEWTDALAVSFPIIFFNNYSLSADVCSLGIIPILCVFRLFIPNKPNIQSERKKIDFFLAMSFILLLMTSKFFPWNKLPDIFNIIQFPWRLFSLASLFIAISIGLICNLSFQEQVRPFGFAFVLMVMCYSGIAVITNSVNYMDIPANYFKQVGGTFPLIGYEYLPPELNQQFMRENFWSTPKVIDNNGKTLQFDKNGIKTVVDFEGRHEYIDVPLIYVKGYSAVFRTFDGEEKNLLINCEETKHLIRVDCSDISGKGKIIVDYSGTFAQKISFGISVSSILAILLYLSFTKWKFLRKVCHCFNNLHQK